VRAVNKTVSGLDGVDKVEITFKTQTVSITMKEGKTLTKETLDAAFKDSKFSVKSFEVAGEKKKEEPPKKEEKKDEKKEEPPKKEDGK
jgi:copper chaperone CopZ